MLVGSYRRSLKVLGNVVFIGIGLALFILNCLAYVNEYLQRADYRLIVVTNGSFYLIKDKLIESQFDFSQACPSKGYTYTTINKINRWFILSSTNENRVFHVFFWFMMTISLIVSILPSMKYIVEYVRSNNYNIQQRYCLSTLNHLIRTFFSMTISILPSFYMKTFDFADSLCFYSYPSTLGIDILPYVFVTYIGLVMYFIVYFILHQFFDKHRFCCANECASYAAFGCLILLLIGFVLFSATIIFYVWIVSFIEKNLRLPAILLVVQVPFLFIQILID
jgi:hypothetical protein